MNDGDGSEELLPITSVEVPELVRQHAARFKTPVSLVACLPDNEFALFGIDGELIDLVGL